MSASSAKAPLAASPVARDTLIVKKSVLIDGNNLLFAIGAHAPVKALGREGLVRRIEHWAGANQERVIVVFDGFPPTRGIRGQLHSAKLDVRFSAARTADDVIADLIHQCSDPSSVRVVSDDKAILYEARLRACRTCTAAEFVDELFPSNRPNPAAPSPTSDKPESLTPDERDYWRREFNVDEGGPDPDGLDAMRY